MNPSQFPIVSRVIALAVCVTAATSFAQFRPPPMNDEERAIHKGDDLRISAAEALSRGDRNSANAKYKDAVSLYDGVLKANPNSLPAAVGLASAASAIGDYAHVVQAVGPVQKTNPDDLSLAFHLGIAHFRLKQYEQAVPLLELVAPAMKSEHLMAHYYLGGWYLSVGKADASVKAYERYLQLRPAAMEKGDGQIYELIGRGYLIQYEPQKARAAYQKAQAGKPESLQIQLGLATALEQERKSAEARALLEGLSTRFPKAPEPKERLGRVYLAASELKKAEQVAVELVKVDNGAGSLFLLGDVKLALGQPKEAEAQLRRAVAAAPQLLPAQLSLARAIQAQGRNDEAIGTLEGIVKAGYETPEVLSVLGSTYRRAGRYREAVATHQRVAQLLPQSPEGQKLLGADHYATGQWGDAIEAFTQALARGADPQSERWLALSLAQRANERASAGRFEDAARDLRRAFDLERTALMGRNLATVLMAQKSFVEAGDVLVKALALPGVTWKDHYLLGYALLSQERPSEALTAYERAAAAAGPREALAEIYAGWALAKLELGEFDAAVEKLTELSASSAAAQFTQANLPVALLRRALGRVRTGDIAGATKDIESVEKLPGKKTPEVLQLTQFANALLKIEGDNFKDARALFTRALGARGQKWADPSARELTNAYVAYRAGEFSKARSSVTKVAKSASAPIAAHLAELSRGIDRRDGESSYRRGAVGPAEKALQAAIQSDPLNPFVIHNLACVSHRRGKAEEAVKSWESVTATLPTATLNLGIDAQERQKDYARAHELYGKYVALAGERAAIANAWRSRLASIYGFTDSQPASDEDAPSAQTTP